MEAVQAAKLHGDMLPERQAIMYECGRTWHCRVLDGHAQITDRTGKECALRKGNDGDMCEQSLAEPVLLPMRES